VTEPVPDLDAVLDRLLPADARYRREAYYFIQRALQYYREATARSTLRAHHRPSSSGRARAGPAGVRTHGAPGAHELGAPPGEDVGEIVYLLIDAGLMSKTAEDSKADFAGVMAFDESLDRESSW